MFDACLYFNASALARKLEREWGSAFSSVGLTTPQAFMLRAILETPGLAQRELANVLAIAPSTATRALDSLEAKLLVERRIAPSNRRESTVHPTPNAVKLKRALSRANATATQRMKMLLGEADFVAVIRNVKRARSALD